MAQTIRLSREDRGKSLSCLPVVRLEVNLSGALHRDVDPLVFMKSHGAVCPNFAAFLESCCDICRGGAPSLKLAPGRLPTHGS